MSQILCDNLTLSYDNRTVLHGLSFTVEKGDCLCIAGENGTGKSTLMRALLGLKAPTEGTITYGEGLTAKQIGYLPQKTDAQKDFPASVWEVVLSGRLNRHGIFSFYSMNDRAVAEHQLLRLGIGHLKNRSFSELSGGQQQRVLLARALCAASELLLLDEPVAGLDPVATAEFYAILEGLHREGMTILMVSHDLLSSLGTATRVLWLRHDSYALLSPEEFSAQIPMALRGGGVR